MTSDLSAVSIAVEQCLALWETEAKDSPHVHDESLVMTTQTDVDQGGRGVSFENGKKFRFPTDVRNFQIISLKQCPSGDQSMAAAQVSSKSSYCCRGWMTLLHLKAPPNHKEPQWQLISAAFSFHEEDDVEGRTWAVTPPSEQQAVLERAWNVYGRANRTCDGDRMATVFHKHCRLTEAQIDGSLFLKRQPEFCQMVSNRYSMPTSKHYPYRYLQKTPEVSQMDSLDAIEFSGATIALVTMQVGHPPCLWTDYLTMAKLEDAWWIVHKSSCESPFLVEEVDSKDCTCVLL